MAIVNELISRLSYPNPFEPSGIEFELPAEADVTLTIFDSSGREVATLLDKKRLSAGHHKADFDGLKLAGAMYFYRLLIQTGGRNFVDTKKIVTAK